MASYSDLTLKEINRYISQGKVTQSLIAKEIGVSPRTLQRKLSKEGKTFSELLDRVRDKKEIELLLCLDLTINDISHALGYSHVTSFHKRFKRKYGTAPDQYRKMVMAKKQDN